RGMKRFAGMISLIAIFGLGSAFTAVCALACRAPAPIPADAAVSHCHQTSEEKELPGPGFRKAQGTCPVLAALESRPNFHAPAAPASVSKAQLGWKFLPFETAAFLQGKARLVFLAEA